MPPRAKVGASRMSRTALLVKKAQERDDPLSDIPELLEYMPAMDDSVRSSTKDMPSLEAGGQVDDDASPDSGCGVSDQGNIAADTAPKNEVIHAQPALKFSVRHFTATSLPKDTMQWAFDVVKRHLKHMYEPVWGWSDKKKMAQLQAASSRFLVMEVDQPGGPPLPAAYVNFRLEPYDGQPVCYLYEVMVDAAFQRMGLGTRLMLVVEAMAWSLAMSRCVLTEFAANKSAEAFYRKLGYRPDATNPKNPTCGYVILSKARPASG